MDVDTRKIVYYFAWICANFIEHIQEKITFGAFL
jgi:hypothetical protein